METDKIILGITHGDINGIGYEVIIKALADVRMLDTITPIIYGSPKMAAYHRKQLDIQGVNLNVINSADEAHPKRINIITCVDEEAKVEFGVSSIEAGKAAFKALERASADLNAGLIHAIVTAPINKKNIQSNDFHFPGHTEYFESNFGESGSSLMMLINEVVRVAVVTGHIALRNVPESINESLIVQKISVLNESLKKDFSINHPRIAVLGLNPHAGDEGVLGDEEKNIITPAIKTAVAKGITCVGPYAADGFFGSGNFDKFDAVLAMYHDQGLIPFKTISMENGVNYTAGLPIIRTSPAHGTAYELAGKNLASEESMRQAIYTACDIFVNRTRNVEYSLNPLKLEHRADKNERANKVE